MSWRAIRRGGTGSGAVSDRRVGAGGAEARARDAGAERVETDAPHVEALVASKRGRWLALEEGEGDGWARGANVRERVTERYDDEEEAAAAAAAAAAERAGGESEASTSSAGGASEGSAQDVDVDGSLMQLYDAGTRGMPPVPGSLALPRTPRHAFGATPAVSAAAAAREERTLRFVLEVSEISFEVGALETVEGTMALYDLQARAKLSENFHFSWPSAKQMKPTAAFTVPAESLSPNIRLIVHLTHLVPDEGGIEDKVYTHKDLRKAKVHADKERQRVLDMEVIRQQQAQAQVKPKSAASVQSSDSSVQLAANEVENPTLSKRRNTLAWAVLPIFDSRVGGNVNASSLLSETKCSEMYRVKENYNEAALMEAAISSGTSHSLKSHKPIRCKMVCTLNLLAIPPSVGSEASAFSYPFGATLVKELVSFTHNGALDWEMAWGGAIDDGLSRDLYVYVRMLDIGKRQDLRVRLQLRDDDLDIDGRGLLAFPSPCGRGLCRESWTTMSRLRAKGGIFHHEARVRLPVRLNPSHHIVLSIYGAQSASTGIFGANAGPEELLGHSVINLCDQPETLAANVASATTAHGGDLSLVAVRELLPKYLQSNVRTHMPYWEERKECVHVRLRLASTMHTGDVHIGALFSASAVWCESQTPETEDKLRVAVSELSLASDNALIQHLPTVLNLLVTLALRIADLESEEEEEPEEQLSSRLSRDSRRGLEDDDAVSVRSGLSEEFAGSVDLMPKYTVSSALSKNDRLDDTQDIGTLAFHTLVRIVAQVQRVDPGPKPSSPGVVSHSPPLEAYITLAFGSLDRSSSKYLTKLQSIGTSRTGVPIHAILAKRYSAVLAATREPYVPYEEALSMSWFFLGMIYRAVALERAQSPSDTISIEHDDLPLTQIIDILSNEVTTRGERNEPTSVDLEKARNLNCGVGMFLTLLFTVPGIKKSSHEKESKNSLGRAGPLAPLATTLASMHIKNLSKSEGTKVHTALLREFFDTLCASPVILDIITASAVNDGKNGWTLGTARYGPGDGLVDAFTEAMRLNLFTVDTSTQRDTKRAACAVRIIAAALTRHAWDRAWQSTGARRSIAAAYAPILRLLIDQCEVIQELPLVARRDALVSVLMLARDSDSAKMWTWICEDAARMKNFVTILSMSARDFAYQRDVNNGWSPSGPVSVQNVTDSEDDMRIRAGHLNTCVYKVILRLIREWHDRGSSKSSWGVLRVARAMGVVRSTVQDPNQTVRLQRTSSSVGSKSPSGISLEAEADDSSDVEIEQESFNPLEGFLGVMLAILSRPQSASTWTMSAPLLNSLLREHRKVLMACLHSRKESDPVEEYPPKDADPPGVSPYAFLQGAAIAVFKAAARPSPVRELAVASLRTMLEAAVDIFASSEPLCPTLVYAMHAAFFPLRPISCEEGLSLSLKALKSGTEVSPAGWINSVKGSLATLDHAENCIRRLANATMNPRSMLDVPLAAELESELAKALNSSPAAHVKVLRSLSARLAESEHWVEAAEASTAAGIVAMQAFSVAAPAQCVWYEHDVQSLRDSFFALPKGSCPVPEVAGIRCGTEEINEGAILAHLSRGVDLFTKGGHLEAALRVNETAQISWETHRQFGSLSESHAMMAELFRRLDATSGVGDPKRYEWDKRGKPPPEPATFWRVRLLGDVWSEMQDSEWIYRESSHRTLGEMNKKIISQVSNYLPQGIQIKVLSTTADTAVDEGCAGIQITAVQRKSDPLTQQAIGGGVGGTGFSQCSTFTFDTPVLFAEDGELSTSHGLMSASLRYQGRRRTTINVDGRFPGLLPRSRVVETVVEDMNPCKSAIQMLEEQTVALLAAANARKPQAELLQRLLQGSLAAGVNGGVPSLIQSFFAIESSSTFGNRTEINAAQFLTPARAIQPSPEPLTPTSRLSRDAGVSRAPPQHKRGVSETVPLGAGIPLDTPTSMSYPSPSPMRAPPPSPASVAHSALATPMSLPTLSPSTPALPLSRADSLELVRALWRLHRACSKVLETHRALNQPEHLEQLFVAAIQDLRSSIEAVERELEFDLKDQEVTPSPR